MNIFQSVVSHIMKNKGILQGPLPTSLSELIDAIDQEGNIVFAMFRSLIASIIRCLYVCTKNLNSIDVYGYALMAIS